MVVGALQTAPVAAQVILATPTEPVAVDRDPSQVELPVSLDRIKRGLERESTTDPSRLRLLDLTEYVVVVAEAPALSLFGDTDLSGGPTRGIHAEMMAVTRPSRLDQAMGSDTLGVATAALVGLAIRSVAGWFSGNESEDDHRPRWAGYTETFVLAPRDEASLTAPTLLFHRLEGQRVSLHTSASHAPNAGVVIAVDGQEWGPLEQEVADRTIPNELLLPGRVGNLHSLTVGRVPGTVLEVPLTIDLLVVVHEQEP